MKTLLFLAGMAVILLSSCRREEVPTASFSVEHHQIQPYEIIRFNNVSSNALHSKWSFGDGTTSEVHSPEHFYTAEGEYTVRLTVESIDGIIDQATITIYVDYTRLEIEVAEFNSAGTIQLLVPFAGVWLYDNEEDWLYDNGDSAILSGVSNEQALITFAGLESKAYYVYVEKADGDVILYTNYRFYEENRAEYYVTYALQPFKTNKWIAWVDQVYTTSREKTQALKPENPVVTTNRKHKKAFNKINNTNSPLIVLDVSE